MDLQRLEQLWRKVRGNRAQLGVVASVLVLGLLLWGRLILLERVPRIATADPDSQQSAPEPGPGHGEEPLSDEGLTDRHNRTEDEDSSAPALQPPFPRADDPQGRDR